jgi:transposase, IS30 family
MAHHLILQERQTIARLWKERKSKAEIAHVLGRSRSTITREISRNIGRNGYRPREAQQMAKERRQRCRRPAKMCEPVLETYVKEKLELRWSPDQIAGRSLLDFPRKAARQISRQTIYTWIGQQGEEAAQWRSLLRRGGPRPKKGGHLKGSVSIKGRPCIVDGRQRYGDWEGDTVVGPMHRNGLLTAVERKSGYLRMAKLDNLKSETVVRGAKRKLGDLPPSLRRTMTFDDGTEFAQHAKLSRQLNMAVYFAQPYCSWQRGTNENTNGLVRQFFPKGTDFQRISHHEVTRVETLINERPRRRHGYRTPAEILADRLCCV